MDEQPCARDAAMLEWPEVGRFYLLFFALPTKSFVFRHSFFLLTFKRSSNLLSFLAFLQSHCFPLPASTSSKNGTPDAGGGGGDAAKSVAACGYRQKLAWTERLKEAKVLHFRMKDNECRMFGHFLGFFGWAQTKEPLDTESFYISNLKHHLHYKPAIADAAAGIVTGMGGTGAFAALHIRRNDFQYPETRQPASTILKNAAVLLEEFFKSSAGASGAAGGAGMRCIFASFRLSQGAPRVIRTLLPG
jgi:hypothetical protein